MNTQESLTLMLKSLNDSASKIDVLRMKLAKMIGTVGSYDESEIDILTVAASIVAASVGLSDVVDLALLSFKDNHKEGDEVILKSVEKKVVWPTAGNATSIDSDKLLAYLLDAGRRADAIKVSSVSEKDLKTLEDGAVLIGKYKKVDGKKKSSIAIKELTEEERKKILEAS
jgi:hypothetical protein